MQLKPGDGCPHMGLQPCGTFKCKFWQNVRGTSPQTGQEVDEWECLFVIQIMLQIEQSKQMRGVAASIDSFRNETVKATQQTIETMMQLPSSGARLIGG